MTVPPTLTKTLRPLAAALAVAAACAAVAVGAPAIAAPAAPPAKVEILRVGENTSTRGVLDASVSVSLARPVNAMSVRYRLYRPGGAVSFQKTESLRNVPAGTRLLALTKDLAQLDLREGVYRLEVAVRPTGGPPVQAVEPVYVFDERRPPLQVAVVVRFATAPMRDPAGSFVVDPAGPDPARVEADALARLALVRPDMRLSFALAPLALDDWSHAAEAHSLATTGSAPVAAAPVTDSASTLRALTQAVGERALQPLGLGYADPSTGVLLSAGSIGDLALQLDAGSQVASAVIGVRSTRVVAVAGDALPRTGVAPLAARGTRSVLLGPAGTRIDANGRETTAGPGVYSIADSTMTALVFDARASGLLSDAASGRQELADYLFSRLTSKEASGSPVVAVVEMGPGARTRVSDLQARLAVLARTGWVRLVGAGDAAGMASKGTVQLPESVSATGVPQPYVDALKLARSQVLALVSAAGMLDPDAATALEPLLTSESAAWTAAGGETAAGQAYAEAAGKRAMGVLSRVTLAIPNVTLSGSTGRVPVSVMNATGRPLALTLRTTPKGLRISRGRAIAFTAMPGENIQSVPVDMGSALTGELHFELDAGELAVASGDSTVRASYMDRIAILGTVVVVLLLLLWYIRRRGSSAIDRLRRVTSR